MNDVRKVSFTWLLALAAALATTPAFVQAACQQWDVGGQWSAVQANDTYANFKMEQVGDQFHGAAGFSKHVYEDDCFGVGCDHYEDVSGPVVGTVKGDAFEATVYWNDNSIGVYTGQVGPQGLIVGTGFDKNNPGTTAQWHSNRVATCAAAAAPPPPTSPAPPALPPKALGRVQLPAGTPTAPAKTLCEAAASARARNSPAAPSLERQCNEYLAARPAPLPPIEAATLDELAAKGGPIAQADPLSASLRARQAEGAGQRGFDIGMAAAENDTSPGPGKQHIHDSLGRAEQFGFDAAVTYLLERNSNKKLAAKGSAIDAADPTVAEARNANPDVFYQLGFDIATGLFGDPKLGAAGNTLMGPGSMKIRNSLNVAGQSGFDDSVKFHLARDYSH